MSNDHYRYSSKSSRTQLFFLSNSAPSTEPLPSDNVSHIKRILGVISGKGGVGKSLVCSLLASALNKRGYNTAILDADIAGPTIPSMFGLNGYLINDSNGIHPKKSRNGVKIVSSGFLLRQDEPIAFRGSYLSNIATSLWDEISWGSIDYMFVDMPSGINDSINAILTKIPLDGLIVVTTPQEIVNNVVKRTIKLAEINDVPVIGVIENMSLFNCKACKREFELNDDSQSKVHGFPITDKIPFDYSISKKCDEGKVEEIDFEYISNMVYKIMVKWPLQPTNPSQ